MRLWKTATKVVLIAAVATLLIGPPAQAQTDKPKTTTTTVETTTTTTTRPWTEPASRWQKGSDLIGKNVQSRTGENIGDVDDLIVDLDSGRVLYYIVPCDGKQCAVPAPVMTLPADARHFTFAATKDQLKAYSFEKRSFPNFNDRAYTTQVYTHYNVRPFWDGSGKTEVTTTTTTTRPATGEHIWYRFPARTEKGSKLIGMDVRNQQNENLGKIEDLAIDPDGNRVIYGVLSFGGFLGVGDKFFAIPWSSLKQTSVDQNQLILSVDKDRLKNATGFDKKNWPNMAEQRWATDVHKFYGVEVYWVDPDKR